MDRMILVPDTSRWQSAAKRSNRTMKQLLQDPTLTERQKLKLYRPQLRRFLTYRRRVKEPSFPDLQALPPPIDPHSELLSHINPSKRTEAGDILRKLVLHGVISWTADGTTYYHGERIPRSNITRLIKQAVSPQRRAPAGWQKFQRGMIESRALLPARVHQPADPIDRVWLQYIDSVTPRRKTPRRPRPRSLIREIPEVLAGPSQRAG